ncbi:uncharacterized protein LOC132556378, partial [Ylistrum balloti]|uniref:uncharacterized protein LOC132556378 n=1 Tax=Ylistrum balloti TaxID=509963 RepID=UPI0029058A51
DELEEMLSKYAPFKLKLNHISNDPAKRFRSIFVKFSQSNMKQAEALIKDKDGKMWKGKKLYVGYARNRSTGQYHSHKEGAEDTALNSVTSKSLQDASSGMMIKPLHRTSSHDSKGFSGTIPKMLPSRREPVSEEGSGSHANKAWWKKN